MLRIAAKGAGGKKATNKTGLIIALKQSTWLIRKGIHLLRKRKISLRKTKFSSLKQKQFAKRSVKYSVFK
jgi:hypothetical protein